MRPNTRRAAQHAAWPSAEARRVFPAPTGPTKITSSWRSINVRFKRSRTRSRSNVTGASQVKVFEGVRLREAGAREAIGDVVRLAAFDLVLQCEFAEI